MTGKRIILFAIFAVAALAFALSTRGSAEAQTYRPFNSYSLTSTAPGANSNSAIGFSIAAPDYNYEDASMTILQPADAVTANGLEAPIGAYAGALSASVAVGLLGGPCNSALSPNFSLKNASVDIAVQDTNTGWILKPTTTPIPDEDSDGLYDYEEKYPSFLNDMLDPDGSGPLLPLQPRARFAGHTNVAGNWVLVQFLVFNPGGMTAMGGIYAQMTPEKGAPNLVVLDNPKQTQGGNAPGAIADFCTPLKTTTTLYGTTLDNPASVPNEAGFIRQANPAANTGVLLTGTHMATNYSQSERDVDGDGFENDLDGCRYTADIPAWNPRVGPPCTPGSQPGDQDCDMLPSSCDPNDAANNTDQDVDGYDNAQDNCPLAANGCISSACGPVFNPLWDNQNDRDAGLTNADLGPRSDAIGDACDDSDDNGNEDGGAAGDCNDGIDNGGDTVRDDVDPDCVPSLDKADWPLVPATQPQQGAWYHGYPWAAACVGGTDTDGDGYCDNLEAILGSPANNGPETGAECNDAVDGADADGVINDGCPFVGKYGETAAQCNNALNDDAAIDPNDTGKINDGCPVIGIPESLVIDATITAAAALPAPTAAQSCSDLIDNDKDGAADAADVNCQAAAVTGDADKDGWDDNLAATFGADITPGHAGNETHSFDDAGAVGAYVYDMINWHIDVGTNNGECRVVRPIDWDGDQEPEALALCNAAYPPIVRATADLTNGEGDPDSDVDIVWLNLGAFAPNLWPSGQDNCPGVYNSDPTNTDATFAATSAFPAGDALGDACDTDDDADGFTDAIEAYLPTDALDRCRNGAGATRSDAWGLDQDLNATITVVGDVLKYSGKIGASVSGTPPTSWTLSRLDLDGNRTITVVGDVLKYSGKIGASCT